MSKEYTFSVKRGGVTVSGLSVHAQLDNISLQVIAGSNGAIPHNSFTLITIDSVPDIRQGDLYIDATTADSKTASGYAEYRVNGNPDFFYQDHVEVMLTRIVVKTT